MLPIDLVLVRHGESEGNVAVRRARRGNEVHFTDEYKARHSASYRLSDRGIGQAQLAGDLIKKYLMSDDFAFDKFYVSEYTRALETAGHLGIRGAEWGRNVFLTERQWGDLDGLTPREQHAAFPEAMRLKEAEPFFARPPNGESYSDLCLRLSKVLETLHRECYDKRVIIVCHGEVMWGFRFLLERLSLEQFRILHESKADDDKIKNCQIIHYTRRDPKTHKVAMNANWVRMLRADQPGFRKSAWQEIVRKKYSNEELLAIVSDVQRMVA